jgi:site-specific recombinase XerD
MENGIHARVVQERMGHKDISPTLQRYSRVTDTMQSRAVEIASGLVVKPNF